MSENIQSLMNPQKTSSTSVRFKKQRARAKPKPLHMPKSDVARNTAGNSRKSRRRKKNKKKIERDIKKCETVDLCFLVDITGNAQPHIDRVRQNIGRIVSYLKTPGKENGTKVSQLRLAFVGYRGFGNSEHLEILNFTDEVETFISYCRSIREGNGGDADRDVLGGIEQALKLDWNEDAGTRVLFHIADARCNRKDSSEPTSPGGRDARAKFKQLREKSIKYYFGKITDMTDQMIEKFSSYFGEPVPSFDIKDPTNISESVKTAVLLSVTQSVEESKIGSKRLRKYTIDSTVPDWSGVRVENGTHMTYELPKSLDDIKDGVPLSRKTVRNIRIKIARNPFAEGGERIAYHGLEVTYHKRDQSVEPLHVVLKEFKHLGKGVNSSARYETSNEIQTIASYFAQQFQKIHRLFVRLKFIKIKTLITTNKRHVSRFMSQERFLEDANFERFSNNFNYLMSSSKASELTIKQEYVDLLSTFSHWTYEESSEYLMVVDLQGAIVGDDGKTTILLTDPSIHCINKDRFRPTNLGEEGMKGFFGKHKCNDICRRLELNNREHVDIASGVSALGLVD